MQELFGIINVFKPSGVTSRDVVSQFSRRIRRTKFGHAGTLDPLAEGVLLIAVGAATRLVPYLQELPKRYLAEFQFGVESDTQDISGVCSDVPCPEISADAIAVAVQSFWGESEQVPPAYSALRIEGQRAYKLARRGEPVDLEPRPISVYQIELRDFRPPVWTVEVVCSKGTYVRTLGVDIARKLGTSAVMTRLTRTAVGPFTSDAAVSADSFLGGKWSAGIQNPVTAFPDWACHTLSPLEIEGTRNGIRPSIVSPANRLLAVDEAGQLMAVLERDAAGEFGFAVNFSAIP